MDIGRPFIVRAGKDRLEEAEKEVVQKEFIGEVTIVLSGEDAKEDGSIIPLVVRRMNW